MKSISLEKLLDRLGKAAFLTALPDGMAVVDAVRTREAWLQRYLPSPLVRRLDPGFARSCPVHPDTGRALYAICRALRPAHIFETGTYWGYSTAYLAAAVRDNGTGCLHTFDIYARAGRHVPRTLRPHVRFYRGKSSVAAMPAVLQSASPSLFFQDSRHDYEGVFEEMSLAAPNLAPGAVVLFHDFVVPDVRAAANDALGAGFEYFVLESGDPSQLGVAVKPAMKKSGNQGVKV